MEPALYISPVSVVLSRWESLTRPGWDINPSQVSSQETLVLIYLPGRMESCIGLGGKEGCTNIRISAKPGIEQGTLWSEGRDLTNCAKVAKKGLQGCSSSRKTVARQRNDSAETCDRFSRGLAWSSRIGRSLFLFILSCFTSLYKHHFIYNSTKDYSPKCQFF